MLKLMEPFHKKNTMFNYFRIMNKAFNTPK